MLRTIPPFLCSLLLFTATPLAAQAVGTDTDGDGLDDLLETRLGTMATLADTDGDGLTDLEEVLSGTRPTIPDVSASASLGRPSVRIEAYATGPELVLQVFLVHETSVSDFRLSWWSGTTTVTGDLAALAPYLAGNQTLPLPSSSGASAQALRFVLPRAPIQAGDATVFTARATVDGFGLRSSLSLVDVQGTFAEVRWLATRASGGLALGATTRNEAYLSALAPWELATTADEPIQDFLCILTFPKSYTIVSPYKTESTVSAGQCQPLPGMTCAPLTCSGSVGEVVRFDIGEAYF